MSAKPICARCSSTQHTTAQCSYSFLRKICPKCNNTCREVQRGAPTCIVVKAQREAEKTQRYEEWKAKDAAYQQRKLRSGSDASSDAASTCAESVDAALYDARQSKRCEEILRGASGARFALSPQEEREARKIEKKLRDIARLQGQLDQGLSVDKLQREKIQSKDALESQLVMQKIFAGAHRPSV